MRFFYPGVSRRPSCLCAKHAFWKVVCVEGASCCGNSPFAAALIDHLEKPGLEIVDLFREVKDSVLEATGNRQEPYLYGSLGRRREYLVKPIVTTPPPMMAASAGTEDEKIKAVTEKLALCRANRLLPQSELTRLESHFNSATFRSPDPDTLEDGFMRFAVGEISLADLRWYRGSQQFGSLARNAADQKSTKATPKISTNLLFSLEGRVSRKTYWKVTIFIMLCSGLISLLSAVLAIPLTTKGSSALDVGDLLASQQFAILSAILALPLFWPGYAIALKRSYDIGRGWGWTAPLYVIVGLLLDVVGAAGYMAYAVAFSYPLYIPFIVLGCVKGTRGPNKYGPDPLAN